VIAVGITLVILAVLLWVVGSLLVLRCLWRRLRGPRSYQRPRRATKMAPGLTETLRGPSRWLRPQTYIDNPEYVDRKNPDA
jgi:hypothetical protein